MILNLRTGGDIDRVDSCWEKILLISTSPNNSTYLLRGVLALLTALLLLSPTISSARADGGTAKKSEQGTDKLSLPAEYGKIVYRTNAHSPRQIFIIGQAHRSPVTGRSGPDTVEAQKEIYRIGEWLIREQHVELLLPEGFFRSCAIDPAPPAAKPRNSTPLDDKALTSELCDTRRFVNADLLLCASCNVQLAQVENEELYLKISRLLKKAHKDNSPSALTEIEDLQKRRTAAMLQNIPGAVEEAFRAGKIENRKAIFTIGLAHIDEIVEILKSESLRMSGTGPVPPEGEADNAALNLLGSGYGVTVIIPRTLAGNRKLRRFSQLETD